jgi:hypothetical protein
MEQNRTERRQGNTGQKRKEDGNNETKKKKQRPELSDLNTEETSKDIKARG